MRAFKLPQYRDRDVVKYVAHLKRSKDLVDQSFRLRGADVGLILMRYLQVRGRYANAVGGFAAIRNPFTSALRHPLSNMNAKVLALLD